MTPRSRRSIGARLLIAQGLVLVATIGTAAAVAALVGPPLFHQHLVEAGHPEESPELTHIEMAYWEASLTALAVAIVVAIGCSLAVTWYLTRRLQRPLGALAAGATDIAGGHYTVRLPATGAGPELDAVTASFNTMAERLEHTEDTRRRLLSDLGHEMRTPVSTMAAYLESLDDGVRPWDAETRAVLHDQVDRLSRLVTDLRDVSAADEGQISLAVDTVPVDRLLAAAADAARENFRAGDVILTVHPVEPAAEVRADPHRIAQVLGNLLTNALRHSPPGSTVDLRADIGRNDVTVVVGDHGDGIAAAQLPHVFERFYRGDTARDRGSRGSGIGLTISRAIVQAHGGTIRVESPGAGRGTMVAFTLPRVD